ncbi:MAG TPA: NADP-dependent oxidoreductase, partial [Roseiflexaceae bacterium]|nr:NADP-dependent oxidoreductase [Roseiflexaceae bacterium]
VAPKPASLDHITAAASPHAVLTAWQGLYELAQLQAGQKVLIHGAAGGVGHIAVQLAKLRGATVIGTASLNAPFLAGLGVDQVINYATTPFESAVHDVDVVLDLVGGETQRRSYAVLKPGGVLVSAVQMPDADTAAMYGVRQHLIMTNPPIGPALTDVAHLVDAGKLKPYVSQVFALQDIQQAHTLIEQHHACGKIAIQISA